jgi:hypothetical protein
VGAPLVQVATGVRLSVIVPVGPGERAWRELLPDLAPLGAEAEILLVAARGQAPPTSSREGRPAGGRWLEANPGRASQQNAGARAAIGETLWFLHADSRVPPGALELARGFTRRDALGYFDLAFRDDGPPWVRLNALGARLRSRWLGLPFGDQGFILPRRLFERLGGFDESLPAGEDHALVWTARRAGVPLLALGAPLYSSARFYAEAGWLRATLGRLRDTVRQAREFSSRPGR